MRAARAVLLGGALYGCGVLAAPAVRLAGSVDGAPPRPGWVYARKGQQVTLHLQLEAGQQAVQVRWFAIEPTSLALDNTQPSFHFEPVRYRTRELEACRDLRRCPADVTPAFMPQVPGLEGLGTMAFQVKVRLGDGREEATAGAESVFAGGLSKEVFKVAIRRDDSYRGYLTELLNTPYIFGSDGPEGRHQADLLVGSDCADLAVYAARREGRPVRYASTWTIAEQAPEVARAERQGPGGRFLDARGRPLEVGSRVREGDLLLFPGSRHVGVLWEDLPPRGVLDGGDLMFHTCWAPPTVEALSASRCASFPVRILRFR